MPCGCSDKNNLNKNNKILNIQDLKNKPIDEIIDLYKEGYILNSTNSNSTNSNSTNSNSTNSNSTNSNSTNSIKLLSPGAHPSIVLGASTGNVVDNQTIALICLYENKASLGYTQGMARFIGSRYDAATTTCYQDIYNPRIECISTTSYNLKNKATVLVVGQGNFNYGCIQSFGCSAGDNCTIQSCTTWTGVISDYPVTVRPYNTTPPSIPTGLTVSPGNGTLTITWNAISDPTGGDVFAYHIVIIDQSTGNPVITGYTESTLRNITIGGLTNNKLYNVEVTAYSHNNIPGGGATSSGTPTGPSLPQVFNICWKSGLSATGACTIPPDQPAVTPGTLIKIKTDIANSGPTGKVRAVIKAAGTTISDQNNPSLATYPGGGLWSPSIDYTMPGSSVIITVEAYGWDGTNYILNDTKTSTISPSAPACTGITLDPFSANVTAGTPINFTATVTPNTAIFSVVFKLRDGTVLATVPTTNGIANYSWPTTGLSGTYYITATVIGQCYSSESAIDISIPIQQWNLDIYVKDNTNNNPISGASVTILTQTLSTDTNGHVRFSLDQGTVTFSISKTGYNTKLDTVYLFQNLIVTELLVPVSSAPGSLRFITIPTGTNIYFGTTLKGTTDVNTGILQIDNLNAGNIIYTVKKTNYNDFIGSATVVGGIVTDVPVSLFVATSLGSDCFATNPGGAAITIDNVPTGKVTVYPTQACMADNIVDNLTAGTHDFKLTLPGYYDVPPGPPVPPPPINAGKFEAVAGQTNRIDIANLYGDLVPLSDIGNLNITSNPTGARIYIDNVDTTYATPSTILNISVGSHTYKLTLAGYQDKTGTFNITTGQTTTIDAGSLTPITPTTGKLDISSAPPYAKIYIDGTDTTKLTPAILDLVPGSHTYKLTLSGYADKQDTFNITVGTTTTKSVTLVPLANTGDLYITSRPVGTRIYIDNFVTPNFTPSLVQFLTQGSHTYKLVLTGYAEKTGSFNITAGQVTNIDAGTLSSVAQAGFGTAGIILIAGLAAGAIYMKFKGSSSKAPIKPKAISPIKAISPVKQISSIKTISSIKPKTVHPPFHQK